MEEGIFDHKVNEEMTGGMRKHDYILQNPALQELESRVKALCPVKLRYSCNVMPMTRVDGFSFVEFLGGIMMTTSSGVINEMGITELAKQADPSWVKSFVHDMAQVPDKYPDFSQPVPTDMKAAVILPGSNIMQRLVCRWILEELPIRIEGLYFKPHPVTQDDILAMLHEFGQVLPREVSAFDLIQHPDIKIFTTMASTLAIQTKLLGKDVFSIEENYFQGSKPLRPDFYVAPFQHWRRLVMNMFDVSPPTWKLQAVLSNPLSGFFYPGYTTDEDIKAYFDYMLQFQYQ